MTKLCNHQEQEPSTCHPWFLLWSSQTYHYLFILSELTEHTGVSSATPCFSPMQPLTLTPRRCTAQPRPSTTDLLSGWGSVAYCSRASLQYLLKEGRVLLIHFPQSDYFSKSSGEWECHHSASGHIHPLSCDDVTDGIFTLISHNRGKFIPKCIAATQALITQLVFSGYKHSFS